MLSVAVWCPSPGRLRWQNVWHRRAVADDFMWPGIANPGCGRGGPKLFGLAGGPELSLARLD
eukprot:5076131-Alexandrium_andersonii.AAC.1